MIKDSLEEKESSSTPPHSSIISGLARKLIQMGKLDTQKALLLLAQAKKDNLSLITCLIKENIMSSRDIAVLSSKEFGIPFLNLNSMNPDDIPKTLLNEKIITEHHGVPIYKRGNRLYIAISDPTNTDVIDEFRFNTGLSIEAILVEDSLLTAYIDSLLSFSAMQSFSGLEDTDLDSIDISNIEEKEVETLSDAMNDAPIVRFVNKVLLDAICRNVSDLHFEPYDKTYRIRYRQDGILHEIISPPVTIGPKLCARLKVMSKLDISERRIPQDGRFKMHISKNRSVDFRVSTCPTLFGEKIVMRILDPANAQLGIDALGYDEQQKKQFLYAIHRPQGMVLVTGPTGSGKTISLYTALNILNTSEVNISTVEDPIEINLPGINQVSMNAKAGLSFSTALKSFLRQDPDIIMVGEIRDLETAEIAIKAAQTGHMVLSTLHTNSAPETIMRLVNIGIEPFNLATSVILIVAQRLARRLCSECKTLMIVPKEALLQSGFEEGELTDLKIYSPTGCEHCTLGFKGRVGLYEVLPISKEMQNIIMKKGSPIDIEQQMSKEGFISLRRAGLNKVKLGLTSLEEINRVTKD